MLRLACQVCRATLRPLPGKPGVYVCPVATAELAQGRPQGALAPLHATSGSRWHFGRLADRPERGAP